MTPTDPQEQKHTKDPWTISPQSTRVVLSNGGTVRIREANANHVERIVVCVNALQGVPDPAAMIEEVREALKLSIPILEVLHSVVLTSDSRKIVMDRMRKARAALALLPAPSAIGRGTSA